MILTAPSLEYETYDYALNDPPPPHPLISLIIN